VTFEELAQQLRTAATARGHHITGDGFVTAACAADLTGLALGTLRNWRSLLVEDLPWRKVAGRVQYDLAGIASFLMSRTITEDHAASSTAQQRTAQTADRRSRTVARGHRP
jgi:hypothetical protein